MPIDFSSRPQFKFVIKSQGIGNFIVQAGQVGKLEVKSAEEAMYIPDVVREKIVLIQSTTIQTHKFLTP